MTVFKNLKEKRREKQKKYERSVLRDIHIKDIRKSARNIFIQFSFTLYETFEEIECMMVDYAIEFYLYGASFGKWGYYGEDFLQIKQRMKGKEKFFANEFFIVLYEKLRNPIDLLERERLYICVEQFVEIWMQKGFQNGTRKYKLRLVQ